MDFTLRSTHQFTKRAISIADNTAPYAAAREGLQQQQQRHGGRGGAAAADPTTRAALDRRSRAEVLARRVCDYYYARAPAPADDPAAEHNDGGDGDDNHNDASAAVAMPPGSLSLPHTHDAADNGKERDTTKKKKTKTAKTAVDGAFRECFACSLNREEFLSRTAADPFDNTATRSLGTVPVPGGGGGDGGEGGEGATAANMGLPCSVGAIADLLAQHVAELRAQLADEHSSRHYERHVRLTQELLELFRVPPPPGGAGGEVQLLGFTPSMVVGGLADVMQALQSFLLKGKLLRHSDGNKYLIPGTTAAQEEAAPATGAAAAAGAAPTERQQHQTFAGARDAAHAGSTASAARLADIPVSSYLPALMAGPGDAGAALSTATAANGGGGATAAAAAAPAVPAAPAASAAAPLTRRAEVEANTLHTVPAALLALLRHCAQPLTLLTPADHQCLPRAVELLADRLTSIIAEVHSLRLCGPLPGADGVEGEEEPPTVAEARRQRERRLGGLTLPQHQAMTAAVRAAAVEALCNTLALFDRRAHERKAKLDKALATGRSGKTRKGRVASAAGKAAPPTAAHKPLYDASGLPDTLVESTCAQLALQQHALSDRLVRRWGHLLDHAVVRARRREQEERQAAAAAARDTFKRTSPTANNEEMLRNPVLAAAAEAPAQALLLDAKQSRNPVTAPHVQAYERERAHRRLRPGADDSTDTDEEDGGGGARGAQPATATATATAADDAPDGEDAHEEEEAQHTLRGVMSAAEEREVMGMLDVFHHLLSIASYARATDADEMEEDTRDAAAATGAGASGSKSKSRASRGGGPQWSAFGKSKEERLEANIRSVLHPRVAVLTVATLARCAAGDPCSSSCVDFMWSLMRLAPEATAEAILYDRRPPRGERGAGVGSSSGGGGQDGSSAAASPTATEHLFQALVNQLNASHRLTQRELRNDLCIFIGFLLRSDARRLAARAAPAVTDSLGNPAVVTAWMALAPLDDDFGSGGGGGGPAGDPATAAAAEEALRRGPLPNSTVDAINAMALVLFDLLCGPEVAADEAGGRPAAAAALRYDIPLLSQNTLRPQQLRFHGVASPTLRRDNLQFKRLGWQALELFCEWQATHVFDACQRWRAGDEEGRRPSRPALYEGFLLVDLCRLGFVDVLLQYLDLACDAPAVVAWTAEELLTLQAECWSLLTALVECAQYNRECYGEEADVLVTAGALRRLQARAAAAAGVVEVDMSSRGGSVQEIELDETQRQAEPPQDGEDGAENTTAADPLANGGSRSDSNTTAATENDASGGSGNSGQDVSLGADDSEDEEDDDVLYVGADLHFLEAGGVECALHYIHDAPATVEPLKEMALLLLATVARCSHSSKTYARNTHVRALLVRTPGLTPLLVTLLESVYAHAFGTSGGAGQGTLSRAMAAFADSLAGRSAGGAVANAGDEFLLHSRRGGPGNGGAGDDDEDDDEATDGSGARYADEEASSDGRRATAPPTQESSLRHPVEQWGGAEAGGGGGGGASELPTMGASLLQRGSLTVALECLNFLANMGDAVLAEAGGIREWAPAKRHPHDRDDDDDGTATASVGSRGLDDAWPSRSSQGRGGGTGSSSVGSPVASGLRERAWQQQQHRHAHRRTLLLSSSREDILQIPFDFAEVGGVRLLVRWMWRAAASPESRRGVGVGEYQALSAPAAATRAPPLSEAHLMQHLDLIYSVLDVARSLVLGTAANEAAFVDVDGVFVLLQLVEALAAAGDALVPANWNAAATSSAYRYGRDPTVIVRDYEPVVTKGQWHGRRKKEAFRDFGIFDWETRDMRRAYALVEGGADELAARRRLFREALAYALTLLSDLLSSSPAACAAFARWHSRRLEKKRSQGAAAAIPHPSATLTFLSAPQMLISVWACSAQEAEAQFAAELAAKDAATSDDDEEKSSAAGASRPRSGPAADAASADVCGLHALGVHVRKYIKRALKREFVRRLLRQKMSRTEEVPRREEVLSYYRYLKTDDGEEEKRVMYNESDETTMEELSRFLRPDEKEAVTGSMIALISIEDTANEELRHRLSATILDRCFGVGIKAYSCLASFGFERFRTTVVSAAESSAAGARQGSPHGSTTAAPPAAAQSRDASAAAAAAEPPSVVALSAAERAQLIAMAAMPSLVCDELCCAMAETAHVELPGGGRQGGASTRTLGSRKRSQVALQTASVAMRPTSPDRRSLRRVLGDVAARGSEMTQLVALSEQADAEQQRQLFDRFLVSRLRHPEGATSVSGAWKTPHQQYPRPASGGGGGSAGSPASRSRGAGGPPPPAELARTLGERLAESHKEQGRAFAEASVDRAFRRSVRHDGTVRDCGDDDVKEATQRARALAATATATRGFRMPSDAPDTPAAAAAAAAASPGHGEFASSYPQARQPHSAPPPLTETAAQTMMRASRVKALAESAGSTRGRAPAPPSSQQPAGSSFKLGLAQRRQRKKDMIANSLRQLPQHHLESTQ